MLLHSRKEIEPKTPLEFLSFIISYGADVFPILRVALQIISQYQLKIEINFDVSTMGQDRLSDLPKFLKRKI